MEYPSVCYPIVEIKSNSNQYLAVTTLEHLNISSLFPNFSISLTEI